MSQGYEHLNLDKYQVLSIWMELSLPPTATPCLVLHNIAGNQTFWSANLKSEKEIQDSGNKHFKILQLKIFFVFFQRYLCVL